MYLSRLQLNPRHRGVRQCVADVHDLHRTLMRAFPQAPPTAAGPREHFGVLHRLEVHPRSNDIVVLVQSLIEPEWGRLSMDMFRQWPCCKCIVESVNNLHDGQALTFRLRANPTRRVRREPNDPDGKWTGKRVALTGQRDAATGAVLKDADQMRTEWLARKGESGGFELLELPDHPGIKDVRIIPEARVFGNQRRKTFWPVLFEGRLRVSDAEAFRATLQQGIGPAKAYGFGLLSIAPAGHRTGALP